MSRERHFMKRLHFHGVFLVGFSACLVLVLRGPRSNSKPVPELSSSTQPDPGVVATLETLLHSPRADVRASALDWIARDERAQSPDLVTEIFTALKDKNSEVRDKALSNMGWILDRYHGTETGMAALSAIQAALRQTSDRAAQLAALELIGGSGQGGVYYNAGASTENPFLISDPTIRKMLVSLLANPGSSLRPDLLRLVSRSASLRSDPAVVTAVAAALQDDDLAVRNHAVRLLAGIYGSDSAGLHGNVKRELESALESSDPNVQLVAAKALGVPVPPPRPQPQLVSLTGEKVSLAKVPFDFNYFTAFVQPLFIKKYGGGACVDCHTPESNSSGRFRILAPGPSGRYTLSQSRVNFVSVLSVIERNHPMESKLLLKPLNPTTREGTIEGMHHDGGVFWASQYDPDFEIVADWLKGAKLEDPPLKQLDFTYFEKYVEQIFSTRGPDGFACVNCHFSHAILHLESPETADGKFSIEEVINNYQSALRVVDESAPADSYIVRKPTSPREGVPGGLSHAGGVRWPDTKQSWQYRALITWMGRPNLVNRPQMHASAAASSH
jgi:HEAT repeat protein